MTEKREAAALRVLRLMRDGRWHTNIEITHPAVGGNRGVGRLWELERYWFIVVEKRSRGEDSWEYRWIDRDRFGEIEATWPKKPMGDRQLSLV